MISVVKCLCCYYRKGCILSIFLGGVKMIKKCIILCLDVKDGCVVKGI